MPTVVPLLVRIGIRVADNRREADHPNWGLVTLPPPADALSGDGTRPEHFTYGSWHYDKKSGHDDDSIESPINTQRGVRLVTPTFAANAMATFGGPPYNMALLTEAQWETFYNDRVRGHMPGVRTDVEALLALKAELDLRVAAGLPTVAILARITKALDPNDDEPGIKRDPLRRWATFKASHNLVIPS